MDLGLAFQVRSASTGIASSIFRVKTSSRSYSAINSFCMSIGNLQIFCARQAYEKSPEKQEEKCRSLYPYGLFMRFQLTLLHVGLTLIAGRKRTYVVLRRCRRQAARNHRRAR